ncbi:MAG TPA: hypothetical protein ENH01_00365 [Nitrospirae bacterium]|nr:hypothetical protein [Nitrospirota bacterium]
MDDKSLHEQQRIARDTVTELAIKSSDDIPAEVKLYLRYSIRDELQQLKSLSQTVEAGTDNAGAADEIRRIIWRIMSILGNLDI